MYAVKSWFYCPVSHLFRPFAPFFFISSPESGKTVNFPSHSEMNFNYFSAFSGNGSSLQAFSLESTEPDRIDSGSHFSHNI
jgi:hypothetical protein